MANNTECLNDIIGVTRKECECFDDDLEIPEGTDPDWYKKSTSGFYIHQLDGIVSMETVRDIVSCEMLWEFYQGIIADSIRETADDVSASINEKYKKKESNFVGFIGSRTSNKPIVLGKTFAGLKVDVNERNGGVIVIKGIGILLDKTSVFNIEVYRRYADIDQYELVDTIEGINSTANAYTENLFEEPLILPMNIENEGEIEYFFLYDTTAGNPRNNLASCGCGRKEMTLKREVDYGGVSGNVIAEMGSWNPSEFSNGIVLDAEIRCNAEAMICSMFNTSPEWGKYIAHAVLYKAGWKIHTAILSSNAITQDVMANRETVDENRDKFDSEYWTRVRYLVQNVDLNLNGCYTCDGRKLKVTQILL